MCGNNLLYDAEIKTPLPEGPLVLDPWDRLYSNIAWRAGKRCARSVAVEGRNVTDVHTTRASCWLSHRAFIRPVSKENRHKLILSTCSCCKEGNREKAIKEKKKEWHPSEWRGLVTQRIWLPSVEKKSEGKSLYSHASGATAREIKAFISLHLL